MLTPWNRQEEWYQAMIDAAGSGGLPPVTASDNGKVLTVENGSWTADSNVFYVTFSYSGGMFYSDKTYAEISDAVASGKEVLGIQGDYVYPYAKSSSGHTFLTLSPLPNQYLNGYLVLSNNDVSRISRQTLPEVTSTDNGSELIVKNGEWAAQQKKFIVTLTPTAPDYSGTMNHTVAEINAAYEAGQEIWFRLGASGMGYLMEMVGIGNGDPESTYPSFNAKFLASDTIVYVNSGYTNDGTKATYSTNIYPLSYASASGVSF